MKKLLLFLAVLVLAYSCKMGKNYKGTDFVMPESFNQEDTAVTSVASDTVRTDSLDLDVSDILWWHLFDDPVLDSLIQVAFNNNRNALIAAESVLQARYALNIQNADFLPKIDFTTQANRGNFLLNQIGNESNLFLGAASVYWELDLFGKLRRLSEAARADLMASEYGYRGVMIALVSEVASTYFQLLQAKSQLEISKRNAFSRDSMLTIIQARYLEGIAPLIDVDQAKIQLAIAAGSVPQYTRNVVQLENALSLLLGQNPGPVATGKMLNEQNYDVAIPLATPTDLLARRPDVIAAEYQLVAQNARIGAAQANRLPTLSVNALLGIASNDLNQLSLQNPLWSIGAQLAGPIFYWNKLKRAADIEKSKRFQSLYSYENTVFNALREVEDILVEIRTFKTEIQIAEHRRTAALQAQDLSRQRYSQGVTSYLEFLEQQRQAFDAELLLESLRSNLLSAYVRLYKALGGGWLSEAEKKTAEQNVQKK